MSRLAGCLIAVFALAASPKVAPPVSLIAEDWWISGAATSLHPAPLVGLSGWWLDLPVTPNWVSSVDVFYGYPLTGAGALTMTAQVVATSGAPEYRYDTESGNTCVFPAHVRFILYVTGDLSEYGRWWSNPIAYQLSDETVQTKTTPLEPSAWSDVAGHFGNSSKKAAAQFAGALRKVQWIGLAFGGGCFFSHGVYVANGTARFVVTNVQVVP